MRDAARPLSDLRDSKVLLETAADLLKTYTNHPCRAVLLDLTRLLRRERKKVRIEMLPDSRTLESVRLILAKSHRTVSCWSLHGESGALAYDVERIYRKSRKAMRLARDQPTDGVLHEARKQVKYLAHALEMLRLSGVRHAAKPIKRAQVIGDPLGADHDLAMILSRLTMLPKASLRPGKALCAHIQEQRAKLQCEILRNGERLHKVKARAFVKRLSLF